MSTDQDPSGPERSRPNPFRNEADAFRVLTIVGLGAAAVVAVTLVAGSLAGFILGVVLVVAGIRRVWLTYRD